MSYHYALKAVNAMRPSSIARIELKDLPVYEDIDLAVVERQLAFVDAAGDLDDFCNADEPTQLAIAADCNAHYANEYLTRAFVTITRGVLS